MTVLDERLRRLKSELDDHARIARYLGLDFERPIRSVGDGYPENAIALVGKITEKLLKQLWRHHEVAGDPSGRTLSELIKGCRPYIRSSVVLDALGDIQRLRNRSTHDGYEIADEDALSAIRRLVEVLVWLTDTGSGVLGDQSPQLAPEVAQKAEFLSGLYLTMGYRLVKRFELSEHSVYQLFSREAGVRSQYVELLLSRDADEVRQVLALTGGDLLQTSLPKLTRFLVMDEVGADDLSVLLGADCRVVEYQRFVDTLVDLPGHLARVLSGYPAVTGPQGGLARLSGGLLSTDDKTGQTRVSQVEDAASLLRQVVEHPANMLVIGPAGSGKTTLLKQLVAEGATASNRRYRFYFDLSLKRRSEDFRCFATRVLAPHMSMDEHRVFDVFLYLIRSGSVLCALDAVDEAVAETSLAGFLDLFAEISELLSAESVVVMSSRVSFLEDSPQVRRLLDGTALISERLLQQLHSAGVDPLRLPRFSVLRLGDTVADPLVGRAAASNGAAGLMSPLAQWLAGQLPDGAAGEEPTAIQVRASLADLVWQVVTQVVADAGLAATLPRLVTFLGRAFIEGTTVFTLVDLCNGLGVSVFDGGRIEEGSFRLSPLFRIADSTTVAPIHSVFQEVFAAQYLLTSEGKEHLGKLGRPPMLTEQVRAFLHHFSTQYPAPSADDCILRPGTYLVGPGHQLLARRIRRPVLFDRYPVTVAQYREFLDAVAAEGCTRWDHPDAPPGHSHDPWRERMRLADYYTNPAYANHPATCVNWWSAYAYARFRGQRLPSSLEWEAAARGQDGRLFPWGDQLDLTAANCADAWVGRPLVTYEAWKTELDKGRLRDAGTTAVGARATNRSPIGVCGMAGNVWEWTSTLITTNGFREAVICGGSYDNPYRAVQASSKGLYRLDGGSNAVGLRCVRDLT